jgi:hypothetical protein
MACVDKSRSKPERTDSIKARGRGPGEGTIYKRVDRRTKSDGTVVEVTRCCALVDLGFQSGRRVRKIVYGHTRGEVADRLATVLANRSRGLEPIVDRAHTTLADWLQLWLADVVKRERRPNTYTLYEETARLHIVPILGRKRLTTLRRKDVEAWNPRSRTHGPCASNHSSALGCTAFRPRIRGAMRSVVRKSCQSTEPASG